MSNVDVQDVVVMSWGDGPFEGMVIGAEIASMAASIAAEDWDRRALSGKPIRGKHVTALAAVFLQHVTRWNLTLETGRPVPVKLAPFLRLHKDRVQAILRMWVKAVHSPPGADAADDPPVSEGPSVEDLDPSDPMLLLEARALQPPGEGEQLVASSVEPKIMPVPVNVGM